MSKQHQLLKKLAEGKETLLPILACPSRAKNEARPLVDILQKMSETEEGLRLLKMLGLTGWKTLTAAERSLLE